MSEFLNLGIFVTLDQIMLCWALLTFWTQKSVLKTVRQLAVSLASYPLDVSSTNQAPVNSKQTHLQTIENTDYINLSLTIIAHLA
jgi:hypothetical protein